MPSQDFYGTYAPLANDIATQTGMDPSVVLGIIDTETGAGQHVQGNNIFGISPGGRVANYPDVSSAGQAFVDLINKRYPGVARAGTVDGQAAALVRGGYNTVNPQYATIVAAKARQAQQVLGYQDEDQGQGADTAVAAAPAQPAQPAKSELDTAVESVKNPPAAPGSATAPTTPAAPATGGQGQSELDKAIQTIGPTKSTKDAEPATPPADDITGGPPAYSTGPDATTATSNAVNAATASDAADAAIPAMRRVGEAAVEGFKEHPFLTPEAEAAANKANDQTLVGHYLTAPLLAAANLPFRALNALAAAGGQGLYEAGAAISPALGRDLYMLNQVLPEAARGAQLLRVAPGEAATTAAKAATPGTSGATFTGVNPLSPEAAERATSRPTGPTEPTDIPVPPPEREAASVPGQVPQPTPTAGAGAGAPPGSVGAMGTPAADSRMTDAEALAYRSTAEGRKLIEQQQPGVPDRNAYVPGVTANLAEQEQNAQVARELKTLKISDAGAHQDDLEAAAANNQARQSHFERIAGSDVDLKNAEDARDAQAEKDLTAAWQNKTEADAQPVLDQAAAIIKSPDGRRPAVRKLVNSVTSELTDEDGNLISDPEQLYGVRKHIDDLLSPEGQKETPLSRRGVAALQSLKNALDPQIEAAAPGFRQYLNNYSNASRRIDEMKVLQGHESKLYDAQNRMTYAKVQTMMRNIVDSRRASGINPYKSISDDTMQQLWNLRDDLRRSSSALELARANGSDTAQNAMDIAKQYAKYGGTLAVHAVANHIAPVAGPIVVRGLQAGMQAASARRAARRQALRAQEILHPPNALRDPNAP